METVRKCGFLVVATLGLFSCSKTPDLTLHEGYLDLPATPYQYLVDSSTNNNVPTLGRVLFYDARLSINNSVSCATCHKQALAFADNVSLSEGFEGRRTFRNSMPIQNLKVNNGFFINDKGQIVSSGAELSLFWDGREKVLDAMVLRPIINHVEMGVSDLSALSAKLARLPEYQQLFTKAYGTPDVDQVKIGQALSQFISSIISSNTKFEKSMNSGVALNALEQSGHDLFFGKYNCNSCHQTQALNGYQIGGGFVNIGLDVNYKDKGLADVTGNQVDIGKFKIPTLRNVALTAPYMHDGRFQNLDEVLEHYSHGIQRHPNLDFRLEFNNKPVKMDISEQDKQAIIAFLNTLTDYDMITDPKFASPFRYQ